MNFDKTLTGRHKRILLKAMFTWRDYKSIFDSERRSITPRGKPVFVLPLRCVLFNNDGDDIDEVYMTTCEKKNEVAQTRDARASQIERNGCFSFQLERRNEGKEKRFVIYVPGKLSPPPVTNCRTKQKRKKSYLVKIQLAAHAIRSPLRYVDSGNKKTCLHDKTE